MIREGGQEWERKRERERMREALGQKTTEVQQRNMPRKEMRE